MNKRGSWSARAFACLLAASVLLAACGGDDDDDDAASAGDDDATTETTAAEGGGLVSNEDAGVSDDAIQLGFMGDLTGPLAAVGTAYSQGALAYAEMVNGNDGVAGRELEITVLDDKATPDVAIPNYRRLVEDENVLAIAGTLSSRVASVLIPLTEEDQIAVVGPLQTYSESMASDLWFHNLAHYQDMTDVAVARALEKLDGAPLVGMGIFPEAPSGEQVAGFLAASIEAAGGTTVEPTYAPLETVDATPIGLDVKKKVDENGLNFVFIMNSSGPALSYLSAIERQGVEDLFYTGIPSMAPPAFWDEVSETVAPDVEPIMTFLTASADCEACAEMASFVEGTDYEQYALDANFAQGWANVHTAVQAIERMDAEGVEASRQAFIDALTSEPIEMGGLTCDIDWSTSPRVNPCSVPVALQDGIVGPVGSFDDWVGSISKNYL